MYLKQNVSLDHKYKDLLIVFNGHLNLAGSAHLSFYQRVIQK